MSALTSQRTFTLRALVGLGWTHYRELVRQPVFGVILAIGLFVVGTAPAMAVFSLGRAEALVLDLGASALLFFVVFLSAVAVAGGSAERISNGTAALLLTQPIGPGLLNAGALLGAALALGQATLLMTCALAWAVRHGPHAWHSGVLTGAGVALGVTFVYGIRESLRGENFQAAVTNAATLLFPLCCALSFGLGRRFELGFEARPALVFEISLLAWQAGLTFAALGIALASRFGAGASAAVTLFAFLLSSLVRGPLQESLGPVAPLTHALPDLQLYWLGDAGYTERPVPPTYVGEVFVYSALYVGLWMCLATASLASRELGRG